MTTVWTKTNAVLLVCSLFLLAGCLQEDSVTVTKDGIVSFTSVVTEPDELRQLVFPVLEKSLADILDNLRQQTWKADVTWASKQRPYRFTITGSGKLSAVAGSTAYYNLTKAGEKTYKVSFLVGDNVTVRVAFESPEGGAAIADAAGKPVHQIENVSAKEVFTIVLP
jgi:hypothetical protein